MSRITLTFDEYQAIRDSMAFARGRLAGFGDDPNAPHVIDVPSLAEASDVLERARWRTEHDDTRAEGECTR